MTQESKNHQDDDYTANYNSFSHVVKGALRKDRGIEYLVNRNIIR